MLVAVALDILVTERMTQDNTEDGPETSASPKKKSTTGTSHNAVSTVAPHTMSPPRAFREISNDLQRSPTISEDLRASKTESSELVQHKNEGLDEEAATPQTKSLEHSM